MNDTLLIGSPPPHTPRAVDGRYGAHNYEPLPVVLVRGAGVHLWDDRGRRHIDMMGAGRGQSRPRASAHSCCAA